jgi:hypothetical protein
MMEWLDTVFALIVGVAIRVGLPVLITVLVVRWLKNLDEHWKTKAANETMIKARNIGCWKIKGCLSENVATCEAAAHPEVPCWHYYRQENGKLQERCIGCEVFKQAPIPVSA